jgi:hypothetical protein
MIKFLIVTRVQSTAFPVVKVLVSVPAVAWETFYRGAIMTWHVREELDRYIAEKVRCGAILIR